MAKILAPVVLAMLWCTAATAASPLVLLPKYRLDANEIAIVVNDNDPLSVRIGQYYQERRGIPASQLIHVTLPVQPHISPEVFAPAAHAVTQQSAAHIQAYVLTWASPERVDCMSITSAFAQGYDPSYCAQTRCGKTRPSTYFNTSSTQPFQEHDIRPTMSIAARSFAHAKALIDRSIRSDHSHASGTAYLLSTTDSKRNIRAIRYPYIQSQFENRIPVEIIHSNVLRDRDDVLFYFTGRKKVKYLDTLKFVPGAIADHLTSSGGELITSRQMSSLRWLEAGATGSYGTVTEPCAIPAKFPIPEIAMQHYLQGTTLIEAYWKSVAWPTEGIFIGEPLANPFGGHSSYEQGDILMLETRTLAPGTYRIFTAPSPVGPFQQEPFLLAVRFGQKQFRLPTTTQPVIRLLAKEESLFSPIQATTIQQKVSGEYRP